jgi:hypothetical protein
VVIPAGPQNDVVVPGQIDWSGTPHVGFGNTVTVADAWTVTTMGPPAVNRPVRVAVFDTTKEFGGVGNGGV